MKHLPLKSLSFLLSLAAVPALAGTDWRDQIANDPRKLTLQQDMIAEGDVDGDGIKDVVAVASYQKNGDDADETPVLFVFQGDQAGGFTQHSESEQAVCASCGGTKGAPFLGSPSINAKGQIVLNYWGGSRIVTDINVKFRYNPKTNAFDAIGYTETVYDSLNDDGRMPHADISSQDANLITGKMHRVYGNGRKVQCKVSEKWKALTLNKFDYDDSYDLYGDLAQAKSCVRVK